MFHLNRISRQIPKKPLEQDKSTGLLCLSYKYLLTASGFQGTLTLLQRVVTQSNLLGAQQRCGELSICTMASHSSWTLVVTRLSLHGPRASRGAVSTQLLLELITAQPNICKENLLDAYS